MPSATTLIAAGCVFGILAALTRRPLTALLLVLYYNHFYLERAQTLTEQLASLDPRAGSYNRRAFEERMREELNHLSYGDRDALAVVMIDLVLAGDNAVVIGMAAAGLPKDQRNKAILVGIIAATVLRIGFALIATQLLQVPGLLFVGGVLLLWVCWKMWRELTETRKQRMEALEAVSTSDLDAA